MTTTPASDRPSTADQDHWLTPGVRGIGSASFLADVGHEIPTALLPSLLTSTLGAPAAALGAIEGVSDALAGAARFGGGVLADDPARRCKVAVGGYTTTAVLGAATAAATSVWQVGVLRAAAWTARGLRVPARNALLADIVPASAYGRAYGFERMMDNLGAIFGPLLALGLVAWLGVRWAIGLSVIPGLLAAVAIVYAIRHTPKPTDPGQGAAAHPRTTRAGRRAGAADGRDRRLRSRQRGVRRGRKPRSPQCCSTFRR
ncbi:MFS transporter [Streptomyces sp. NPDC058272]|uniref:MFS transporter n=1 Tax=Streptomyces sp. NPDC058272 TaxID=3346415 RepID=UPI0036F088C5